MGGREGECLPVNGRVETFRCPRSMYIHTAGVDNLGGLNATAVAATSTRIVTLLCTKKGGGPPGMALVAGGNNRMSSTSGTGGFVFSVHTYEEGGGRLVRLW